ncbi:DNA-directed RNA polymerase III subunit RPC8-like protein [Globomyces pollinis-pini]|nr:DNA-directed RNA polymerase III subunit RPC8-like protein [Globomyces pollinis-pini]
MFILSTIQDHVRVPPSAFSQPQNQAIEDELNSKYANKVLHNVGFCIRVFDILSTSDPMVHACQDGAYQSEVTFRLIVFRPFKDEILVGTIRDCHEDTGIRISLQFFTDIFIPAEFFRGTDVKFHKEEGLFYWDYQGTELFFDRDAWIRFRVETTYFHDAGPIKPGKNDEQIQTSIPAFKIIASCVGTGLGCLEWWQ